MHGSAISRFVWKRAFSLSVLWIGLAACSVGDDGPSDDALAATRAFLGAIERGDCNEAWAFFSRATQETPRRRCGARSAIPVMQES